MPVSHDVECNECGRQDEVFMEPFCPPSCKRCGGNTRTIFIKGHRGRDWFRPGYWPHMQDIDEKPLYIESKEQLKQECEKRGVYARCLLEETTSKKVKQEITPTHRPAVEKIKRGRERERVVVEQMRKLRIFE